MTTYRIKQFILSGGRLDSQNAAIDVPTVSKAKTQARKLWGKLARAHGALVRVELFAVNLLTEKPVARLEGRWPDTPHWRNFQ